MYNIEISEQANEDLTDLFIWIAYENDAPQTAFNYLQEIYDKIKSLEKYPTKNSICTNYSIVDSYGPDVRRYNHKSHAIFYSINEIDFSVFIIRVIRQNSITG